MRKRLQNKKSNISYSRCRREKGKEKKKKNEWNEV